VNDVQVLTTAGDRGDGATITSTPVVQVKARARCGAHDACGLCSRGAVACWLALQDARTRRAAWAPSVP
jgi:hypothetical protein